MSGVPPLPAPSGPPRCPQCGALNPPTSTGRPAEWCSQCLAPLTVAPEPEPVAPPPPTPAAPPPRPADAPAVALDPAMVDRMLIELRASEPNPWLERSEQVSGKGARLAFAVLAGITVLVIVLALAWVIGALVA